MTDLQADAESQERPSPAGALRLPNFRRLWLNNVGYFMAFNALRFVFSWYVLDGLGLGEREQGYVVFALGIPSVFLILQAGVWADRLDRRLMLIGTQAASTAVMIGTALLIASGRASLALVLVAAVLAGITTSIGQPLRAALIPALVGKEQLFGAIALNALAMTTSMILGPVVARAAGEAFGFQGAFWFMAVLLALGLIVVWSIVIPPIERTTPQSAAQPEARRSVTAETVDAVRHVINDRALRSLFLLLSVAGVTVNPAVMITLQAFVKEELGRDSGDTAIPFMFMGIGIAITSVYVMRRGDMPNKGAAFQRAMMVGGTVTMAMGFTTDFYQLLPLSFVMGLAGGFYINMNQGLIQANTPQELMGRVMGLFTLVQAGFMPLGALVLGLVANRIGIGVTISTAAATALVVVVTTYFASPHLRTLS
ncbi:MAG: MFS transporter [Actinomycetota bacterium]